MSYLVNRGNSRGKWAHSEYILDIQGYNIYQNTTIEIFDPGPLPYRLKFWKFLSSFLVSSSVKT